MSDIYDQRAAEAEYARPEAQEAAARVARGVPLDGAEAPAYLAHAIEVSIAHPEILQRAGQGVDDVTGKTWTELINATTFVPPAGADADVIAGARAAAIRIARAYQTYIGDIDEFLEWAPYTIAEALTQPHYHARVSEVEAALRGIQAHRRLLGMSPLDTQAAGWTEEDVIMEADRIQRLSNPLEDLKHRLM